MWAEDRFTARIARGRVSTAELLDSGRIVRRQPAARHGVDEVVVDFGVKGQMLVKQWPREQSRFEMAIDIGPEGPLFLCEGEDVDGWLGQVPDEAPLPFAESFVSRGLCRQGTKDGRNVVGGEAGAEEVKHRPHVGVEVSGGGGLAMRRSECVKCREQERSLVRPMTVDRGACDVGLCGDVGCCDVLNTAFEEDFDRGVEDDFAHAACAWVHAGFTRA